MKKITIFNDTFFIYGVTIEKYAGSLLLMKGDITCGSLLLVGYRLKYKGLVGGENCYEVVRKE